MFGTTGTDEDDSVCAIRTEGGKIPRHMSRIPGQNGISQASYIVEIYHSGT